MATEYFSTEASVQAKATALDIQWWLDPDKDGNIDQDALESGMKQAKSAILSYVQQRYGSTVTDLWDSDTRPEFIGQASDWLTLYYTLPGYSIDHPAAVRFYEQSIADLEAIRDYTRMIPGVTFQSGQEFATESTTEEDSDCVYDYDTECYG
jgi:hypothetical protein